MGIESEFEKEHLFQSLSYNKKVEASLTHASRTIGKTVSANTLKGSALRYSKRFKKDIDTAITTLRASLQDGIETRMSDAWGLANLKNDAIEKAYLAGTNVIPNFGRINLGSLDQFIRRSEGGLQLSSRVFNVGAKVQDSLSTYLSSGIVSGRSAVGISRDLGHLVKGGGVVYKGTLIKGAGNATFEAIRLAATETNSAYRMGDLARRKQLPFIRGIEIHLSGQHPRPDICNEMVGDYPKDFIFTGWHPLCICFSTAIMMSKKEFLKGLKKGNITSANYISNVPTGAVTYIKGHTKAITKQKPYWYINNFNLISQTVLKTAKTPPLKKKVIPKGNQNLELDGAIPKKVDTPDIKYIERDHLDFIDDFRERIELTRKDAKKAGVTLSKQEGDDIFSAISSYTAGGYRAIRQVQRGEAITQEFFRNQPLDRITKYGTDVEKTIGLLPSYNKANIYRGVSYVDDQNSWQRYRNLKKGEIIDHGGTSSWSSDRKVAKKFSTDRNDSDRFSAIFKNVNKFRENTSVNHLSRARNEAEVLVSKNTKFRVVSVKVTNVDTHDKVLEIVTEAIK